MPPLSTKQVFTTRDFALRSGTLRVKAMNRLRFQKFIS